MPETKSDGPCASPLDADSVRATGDQPDNGVSELSVALATATKYDVTCVSSSVASQHAASEPGRP